MHGNYTSHGRLSLLCSLTVIESFLRFQVVKNKARDIRLLNIFWFPRRLRNAFRMASLWLLCATCPPSGRPVGVRCCAKIWTFNKYCKKTEKNSAQRRKSYVRDGGEAVVEAIAGWGVYRNLFRIVSEFWKFCLLFSCIRTL